MRVCTSMTKSLQDLLFQVAVTNVSNVNCDIFFVGVLVFGLFEFILFIAVLVLVSAILHGTRKGKIKANDLPMSSFRSDLHALVCCCSNWQCTWNHSCLGNMARRCTSCLFLPCSLLFVVLSGFTFFSDCPVITLHDTPTNRTFPLSKFKKEN